MPAASDGQLPTAVGKTPRLDQLPPELPKTKLSGPSEREIKNLPVPIREKPKPKGLRAPPESLTPPTTPMAAVLLSAFDGLHQRGEGVYPPDANGSVSSRWYLQWVNSFFTKIDKHTGQMTKPTRGNRPWQRLRGTLCARQNDGDPIALFDKRARRWLLTQFALDTKNGRFAECIAVSADEDPMGSYTAFEYKFPLFNDYPKFGIWRDGYYATFIMADHMNHPPPYTDDEYKFAGGQVCAFERDKMLSSSLNVQKSARMKCFELKDEKGELAYGMLPADIDGTLLPPGDTPEYLLSFVTDANALILWRLHVDWGNLDRSALSDPVVIPVKPFEFETCPPDKSDRLLCVPQKGTTILLDSMAVTLMYRLSYRNFGDRESLFVTHTVNAGKGTGIRWYELSRSLSTTPEAEFEVRQQQTFAPDDNYRWLGSMASDKMGNLLVTYNVSGQTMYPSFRFAGRRASDPLSELSAEGVIAEGKYFVLAEGQEKGTRWGDYASVSLDPNDDCTFWATGQYKAGPRGEVEGSSSITSAQRSTSSPINSHAKPALVRTDGDDFGSPSYWDTIVASIKFPDCH
jgi:hypothetical protein